jgi:hypothetical protein
MRITGFLFLFKSPGRRKKSPVEKGSVNLTTDRADPTDSAEKSQELTMDHTDSADKNQKLTTKSTKSLFWGLFFSVFSVFSG